MKNKLAFLNEQEARQQHGELLFAVDFRNERAKACQQQGEALGKTLTEVRKHSEAVQAQLLAARLAKQALAIQEQLDDGKAALAPLIETIEKAYTLTRTVDDFNRMSATVKIPAPTLLGDPGAIRRLGEIRLHLPSEWVDLGRNQKRVRFTMPFKGNQAGEVEVLPERDAALLVSQGWAVPEE